MALYYLLDVAIAGFARGLRSIGYTLQGSRRRVEPAFTPWICLRREQPFVWVMYHRRLKKKKKKQCRMIV